VAGLVWWLIAGCPRPAPEPVPVPVPAPVVPKGPDLLGERAPEVAALPAEVQQVHDLASFEALLVHTRELASQVTLAAGERACEDFDYGPANQVELLQFGCDEISQTPTVTMPPEPWQAVAQKTPSPVDDAYVELMGRLRGGLSGGDLLLFEQGCLALGQGHVAAGFDSAAKVQAEGEPESLLVSEATALRDELVTVLKRGPYCPGEADIRKGEVETMLARSDLTEDERKALQAALQGAGNP
jgi:hypothetical protein